MWADTYGVFCPYSPAAAVDLPETNTFFFFKSWCIACLELQLVFIIMDFFLYLNHEDTYIIFHCTYVF